MSSVPEVPAQAIPVAATRSLPALASPWTRPGRTTPLVRLKAVCEPGDEGEPVITVMMLDED